MQRKRLFPKFNSKDKIHLKLAELSKNAHELAKRYCELKDLQAQEELKEVEEEIDKKGCRIVWNYG